MPQAAVRESSSPHPPYRRHRPDQTLLYQIVKRFYPEFRDVMAAQSKSLPAHVQQEFEEYLKCGRLEHGFHVWCGAREALPGVRDPTPPVVGAPTSPTRCR